MHQPVGFQRDQGVDVVGGGQPELLDREQQISPTSRPIFSGSLTPTPTSSNSGCLTISAITILPTNPVPQTTTRFVSDSFTAFTIGGLAIVGNDLPSFGIDPNMTAPLTGRRALVTGGSRGIGAEIVRRLAADGAAVAFTYAASVADAEKLVAQVAEAGGTAIAIQADSADPEQVARSVDDAVAQLGGLDVLVNNAGVAYVDDAESFPLEQFDRLVAVNVRAVFVATQRALPHLGDGGRIINIGSINADRVPVPGLSVYAMTKGAVASLTRGWPASSGLGASPSTTFSPARSPPK